MLTVSEENALKYKEFFDIAAPLVNEGNGEIIGLSNLDKGETEDLVDEIFASIYKGKSELAKKLYDSTQGQCFTCNRKYKKPLLKRVIIVQEEMGWNADIVKLASFKFSLKYNRQNIIKAFQNR